MKSERHHELKTNELADWLTHLPQWAKKNLTTIIGALIIIVVVGSLYFWKIYMKNMASGREQLKLTGLISQLPYNEREILRAHSQGRDISFALLQPAVDLEAFAKSTSNDSMAALALIKRAEALRMELHYRVGTVSEQEVTEQINRARASYAEALKRASASPSLQAAAKFGIGLCEEELGNFEKARQIYRDIAASPDLDATVAQAAAKNRLKTMADYEAKVVFKASPVKVVPAQPAALMLPVEITHIDTNLPAEADMPAEADIFADMNLPAEINLPGG